VEQVLDDITLDSAICVKMPSGDEGPDTVSPYLPVLVGNIKVRASFFSPYSLVSENFTMNLLDAKTAYHSIKLLDQAILHV
jgi:hypothetical protein